MKETIQPKMGLTFEHVWATIQELAEQHKETERAVRELAEQHKENERLFQESKAENERLFQESKAENERLFQESKAENERLFQESKAENERFLKESKRDLDRSIGRLGNRFGDLIEHLVSPNLLEKFNRLGYAFTKTNTRVKYKDIVAGRTLAEVDVLLENGDSALVIEIKADPSAEDVKDHVKRMETLRAYADARGDRRGYIGAIAGGIVSDAVKSYALKNGFYVLEQSGDTVRVAETPDEWRPKKW